jgi:hypothetical protein
VNERSHIHLLAAWEFVRHNGKLAMQDCINVVEAAYMLAEHTDSEMQAQLDAEEKAAQQAVQPATNKVQ